MIDTSSTEAMPTGEDGTMESGMPTTVRLSELQAYFEDEYGAWTSSQHNLLQVAIVSLTVLCTICTVICVVMAILFFMVCKRRGVILRGHGS